MFKKVLQSISKSLSRPAVTPALTPAPRTATPPPTQAKTAAPPVPAGKAAPAKPVASPKSMEDLLGIDAKMSKDQIREQLKLLYRRYNRAASSLDNTTRAEADAMLDAIVAVREKNFGAI